MESDSSMQDDLSGLKLIFYKLVSPPGSSFMDFDVDFVKIPSESRVSYLKESLREYSVDEMGPWDPSKIKVFKNQAAFEAKEMHLRDAESLQGLGESEESPLIVLVPRTRDIYVKFSQNQPVPFNTHVENPKGRLVQTLATVGDIIGKSTWASYRSLLGLPEPLGHLTLYHHKDEVDDDAALRKLAYNYDLYQLPVDEGTYEKPLILKLILPSGETRQALIALSSRKRRSQWTSLISLNIPDCDPTSPIFKLNRDYLLDSGLPEKSDVVLYRRTAFLELFTFLQERVINKSVLGYVLGSPGSGKSMTALAFAVTLRQHWVVTWIHVSEFHYPICMRLENGQKKTRTFGIFDEPGAILNEVDPGRHHIVFLDGIIDNNQHHVNIYMKCSIWQKQDKEARRLVVVSSMLGRLKAKLHEDKLRNLETFFMCSWTKEEYYLAVQEKDFYDSIKKNLDAVPEAHSESHSRCPRNLEDSNHELVEAKYYFAGGSARFMFQCFTREVVKQLEDSVNYVDDITQYLRGFIGNPSNKITHRLFTCYHRNRYGRDTWVVSRFASILLALKKGPSLITGLERDIPALCFPKLEMADWMMDMWLFANMKFNGLTLYDDEGSEKKRIPDTDVRWFDDKLQPLNFDNILKDAECGIWLKPSQWSPSCYDAVYIHKEKQRVCFVQSTLSETRALNLHYFARFLKQLREMTFEVKKLEIIQIVTKEQLERYPISYILGSGLLSDYGWEEGRESDMVERLLMKSFKEGKEETRVQKSKCHVSLQMRWTQSYSMRDSFFS